MKLSLAKALGGLLLFVALAVMAGTAPNPQPPAPAPMPLSAPETVTKTPDAPTAPPAAEPSPTAPAEPTHLVTKVVDGDTIDVSVDGKTERIRMIGINTPETVDPRKPVECFGKEASDRAKALLNGQRVRLEADATQGDRDKYGRLLRYVFLGDANVNLALVSDGYAYEYTYDGAYKYQAAFKQAQKEAAAAGRGLWAAGACAPDAAAEKVPAPVPTAAAPAAPTTPSAPEPVVVPTASCVIKGNISSNGGEKIYHVPGCGSYNATIIDEPKGERWFCTENAALEAGWRKARNC